MKRTRARNISSGPWLEDTTAIRQDRLLNTLNCIK